MPDADLFQGCQDLGMNESCRPGASAESLPAFTPVCSGNGFCHLRAAGIAVAEEQDFLHKLSLPQVSQVFFDRLQFELQLIGIGFQVCDLFLFCLILALEVLIAFAVIATAAALALPLTIASLIVVVTILTHCKTPFFCRIVFIPSTHLSGRW
jgi:hypothetical protein